MLIAAVVVSIGLLIVGFGGDRLGPPLTGGVVIGLGVASMHYMGMSAMRIIFGASILTIVLTAAVSLSPTEAEIRKENELIARIASNHCGL